MNAQIHIVVWSSNSGSTHRIDALPMNVNKLIEKLTNMKDVFMLMICSTWFNACYTTLLHRTDEGWYRDLTTESTLGKPYKV